MKVYKIHLDEFDAVLTPAMTGGGFKFKIRIGSYEIINLDTSKEIFNEITGQMHAMSLIDYGMAFPLSNNSLAYITQEAIDTELTNTPPGLLGAREIYNTFKGHLKAEKIREYVSKLN